MAMLLVIGAVLIGVWGIQMLVQHRRNALSEGSPEPASPAGARADDLLAELKAISYADKSLKAEVASMGQFAPELELVLAAIDAGRCEEALQKAEELVAAGSPDPETATLVLAHARASCGDRVGAIELLKGSLEKAKSSSLLTLSTWHRLRELGAEPPAEDARQVLGVIIDIAFLDQPDTVVIYADGSSRYLSGGGGALLDERRPAAQEMAKLLFSEAGRFAGSAEKAPDPHAPPKQNTFRFTFLTPSGPLVRTFTEDALEGGRGELAAFFSLVAELIKLKTKGIEQR